MIFQIPVNHYKSLILTKRKTLLFSDKRKADDVKNKLNMLKPAQDQGIHQS